MRATPLSASARRIAAEFRAWRARLAAADRVRRLMQLQQDAAAWRQPGLAQ